MPAELPSFASMWSTFPQGTPEQVKELIGGHVQLNDFKNTCAVRVSRSLNYSGAPIPKNFEPNWAVSGADGRWYVYRVDAFRRYLTQTYGAPDVSYSKAPGDAPVPPGLQGVKGIIAFKVAGWSNATGHITLWNGSQCADACYFGEAEGVEFWEAPA
jgi:hypothetical protein